MSAEDINEAESHTAANAEKNYVSTDTQLKLILQSKYLEGWTDSKLDTIADVERWNVYEGVFGDAIKATVERIKSGLPNME